MEHDKLLCFPIHAAGRWWRSSTSSTAAPMAGRSLLKACDERLGLTQRLIDSMDDRRQPGKVQHVIGDLVRQRLHAIAYGHPDGNDASQLGSGPIHKLLCGRDPLGGEELASQPTLSRFESAVDRSDLYRMGSALADTVIERQRRRLRRKVRGITIDPDPTDDPTHGAQQRAFFNGHWDTWCYLPVAGFLSFNVEPEQYLFAYVLHPGNVTASIGAIGILSRLLPRLRAGRLMGTARRVSRQTGETAHLYSKCRYAAKTRCEPRDNPRFVVTNLKHSPRHLYEAIYCARGAGP
jgi:hypothetical protein